MYAPAEIYGACDDSGEAPAACARGVGSSEADRWRSLVLPQQRCMDLRFIEQDLSIVHILRLDQGASRRKAGIDEPWHIDDQGHRLRAWISMTGILAVSPARAVWEVACRSTMESGVVTADSALRKAAPACQRDRGTSGEASHYFPGSRQGRVTMRFRRRTVRLAW